MTAFRSPVTGAALVADTPHSLAAPGERWPVVDGIAYLRAGSEARAAKVLALLDRGQTDEALMMLLVEQDRWWDGPLPGTDALRALLDDRDRLNLRQAMSLLGYGRVGDYFAHRWSDPTFVAGLALMDACWPHPHSAFELACGIGHYLRELRRVGVAATGADIVFSKLWLARHWVVDAATRLVCMDASAPFAVAGPYDLAVCHDAFYFFENKTYVAKELKALAPNLLLAHIHNSSSANLSSAAAVDIDELASLFPDAQLFADEELTAASVARRAPTALTGNTEAFGVAVPPRPCRSAFGALSRPDEGARLCRNPLIVKGRIAWPSDRYEQEYAPRATYSAKTAVPPTATMSDAWARPVARRELVDLPERW